jgi:hypothetical protein
MNFINKIHMSLISYGNYFNFKFKDLTLFQKMYSKNPKMELISYVKYLIKYFTIS